MNGLEYYYMHGYQIMNPLTRMVLPKPEYKKFLEGGDPEDKKCREFIQMLLGSISEKVADGLKIDANTLIILKEGKVPPNILKEKNKEYIDALQSMIEDTRKSKAKDAKETIEHYEKLIENTKKAPESTADNYIDEAYSQVHDALKKVWGYVKSGEVELKKQKAPDGAFVIRGDGSKMFGALGAQLATKPIASSKAGVQLCLGGDKDTFRPNQFFSTSDEIKLASLAERALIWIILLKKGSSGRTGGQYQSEKEVLFPPTVAFGVAGIASVIMQPQITHIKSELDKIPKLKDCQGFEAIKLHELLAELWETNKLTKPKSDSALRFVIAREL